MEFDPVKILRDCKMEDLIISKGLEGRVVKSARLQALEEHAKKLFPGEYSRISQGRDRASYPPFPGLVDDRPSQDEVQYNRYWLPSESKSAPDPQAEQ